MRLPPELRTAIDALDQSTSESSAALLTEIDKLKTKFKKHNLTLRHETLPEGLFRLTAVAEATFGRTRPLIARLAQEPWKLELPALVDEFDHSVLCSESFLRQLCHLRSSDVAWDIARIEIRKAHDQRLSSNNNRSGISGTRAWMPQDVKDAAHALQVAPELQIKGNKGKRRRALSPNAASILQQRESPRPHRRVRLDTPTPTVQDASPQPHATSPDTSHSSPHNGLHADETVSDIEVGRRSPASILPEDFDGVLGDSILSDNDSWSEASAAEARDASVPDPGANDGQPEDGGRDGEALTADTCDAALVIPDDDDEDRHAARLHHDQDVIRCLGRLEADNWLDDDTIWRLGSIFAPANTLVFSIGSPPSSSAEWRVWALHHKIPVRPHHARVLVPLCLAARKHWVLFILDIQRARATVFDPLPASGRDWLDAPARALVSAVGRDFHQGWCLHEDSKMPKQQDMANCGIFVVVACLYSITRATPPASMSPPLWRLLFRYALLPPSETNALDPISALEIDPAQPSAAEAHGLQHISSQLQRLKQVTTLAGHVEEALKVLSLLHSKASSNGHALQCEIAARGKDIEERAKVLATFNKLVQRVRPMPKNDAKAREALDESVRDCEAEVKTLQAQASGLSSRQDTLRRLVDTVGDVHLRLQDEVDNLHSGMQGCKAELTSKTLEGETSRQLLQEIG